MKARQTKKDLMREVEELKVRLQEAEEVIHAIRGGEIDGLLVTTPEGERVYTLEGAELPYRIFVEEMGKGAITLTHDGIILYCNPFFARMLNLPQEKVIQKSVQRFVHPSDRDTFDALFEKGRKMESEGETLLKNNIPVHISLRPLPIYDASPVICGVLTDLRQQKKYQKTVDSLNRSRAIFNQAIDAIIICDERGIITQASPEARRYCHTKVLGLNFDSAFKLKFDTGPPLQEELFSVSDVLEGRIFRKQEAVFSDGANAFHFLLSARRLFCKKHEVLGCVVTLTDITVRRQAEEEIRRQRLEIEQLYDNAPVGLCMLDKDLRFIRINEWLAEINGIPAAEHIGKTIRELLPELADEVEPPMRRILETGEPQLNIEIISSTPARLGVKRSFLEQWLPIREESGLITGLNIVVEEITERRQIEEALRESEERLRLAWKATRDVIWDWDIVNNSQCWSGSGTEVFGWTDAVDAPQTEAWWLERIHPDDRRRVTEGFHCVLNDALCNQWQDEYRFLRKDGTVANVLDRGFVLRDGEGKPTRMIGALLDITDIIKTRQELEQTRNMLAEAQKIAHLGSFEYIAATRTTLWSEEEYRIYGLDSAGPSPTFDVMLAECIHPDDAALLNDTFTKAMQNRSVFELEHRIVRPDGSVRWVYDRAHPYFDEDGSLLRYIGATLDVTDRKQAEEALQQSQKDLERAQQVGQIGSWRLDIRHNVLTWSDENNRIFGVPPGIPLTYEAFLGVVHPDDRNYVDTRWKAALAGKPYDIEHRILADGRVKWVREKAYLEFDEAGTLRGGFGITQDITERKLMEEALRQRSVEFEELSATLEKRVLERTEELRVLNQKLQESQVRLRRLSQDLLDAQEKERKKVAWELHDSIGSSLTAIKFRIENVLREGGSQAMANLVKVVPVVQTAVMEAKRIQMNLRPSMLDDLGIVATTRWFFNQFRETYPEVQLEQHIKIEEDDVHDSLKTVIFRIFQEGLNNAARHSNSPVVSLYLWKSNRTLKLLIRDRGQGFDLSEVQSRTSHSRGLGLESMRERAELSGGRFSVATKQGKGTVVRVSWPIDVNS